RVDDPGKLADTISAHLLVGVDEKQNLLEIISPIERLNRIAGILEIEVDKLQVDRRIQSRVKKQMEKAQKEYYLNEKMKAIQKELGRKDEKGNEVDELKKKIETAKMPKDVEEKAIQELKRLEAMPPMSAEATVSRNYLDWLIAVPWPRHGDQPVEVVARDRRFRGHRRHRFQALELLNRFLLDVLRHLGRFDLFLQLVDLVPFFVLPAQFLLDRLHLLVE